MNQRSSLKTKEIQKLGLGNSTRNFVESLNYQATCEVPSST